MSERFSLKWNDFQSVVSQSFSVLRREEDFYDVTLVSDDQTQIPAHKLVLSASSHFFKSILKRNPHSHPLLYLSGVNSANLNLILDYIYQGEVQVNQEHLESFLEVAQRLKLPGSSKLLHLPRLDRRGGHRLTHLPPRPHHLQVRARIKC